MMVWFWRLRRKDCEWWRTEDWGGRTKHQGPRTNDLRQATSSNGNLLNCKIGKQVVFVPFIRLPPQCLSHSPIFPPNINCIRGCEPIRTENPERRAHRNPSIHRLPCSTGHLALTRAHALAFNIRYPGKESGIYISWHGVVDPADMQLRLAHSLGQGLRCVWGN